MDWEILKNRRRTTLEKFIDGAEDEQAALKIFEERGVSNPPAQEISELFESRRSAQKLEESKKQSQAKKTDSAPAE